ncbi:Uncharacterised protein [Campylobacter jejuni]|uniref:Uncharacterized protein n=1 Tax=Campylobacter jejuni TaxID=197 RepID=A0AAX2M1U9_CAMJU|nr:Uncharacterised protein [Campylobacter jejuni]
MARMMTNGKSMTKEELVSKIESYFNERVVLKETKESIIFAPKTKVGLAVYLGITIQTLGEWEKIRILEKLYLKLSKNVKWIF